MKETYLYSYNKYYDPKCALPLSGEIKATTLEEAISNFSDAINEALKKLQDDMIKMQQEQANKIVTPDDLEETRFNHLIVLKHYF